MKIKYIDKRHWRRLLERDYIEVKVNNNRFKGIIGLVTMKKVREPLEVTVVGQNIIVADDNYQWLQILPEKKRYSITAMFDDKGNPLSITSISILRILLKRAMLEHSIYSWMCLCYHQLENMNSLMKMI